MEPGYSRVLVHEYVLLESKASWQATALDLIMMTTGSKERSEVQWRSVFKASGLRITGIWTLDPAHESLIEAVIDEHAML